MKKKSNFTYLTYVGVILLLIVVSLTGSYAWYTASVTNTGTVYTTVITAGNLKLGFENSQYFNTENMVIIGANEVETKAEKSTFDVKNTGDLNASYELYFNTTITNNLINDDFKWELLVDGTSYANGTFGSITANATSPTTASFKITPTALSLAPSELNHCVFRVWLQETDENQNGLTEGVMSGKVSITAVTK